VPFLRSYFRRTVLATAMAHLTQEARPPRELSPALPVGVDAVVLRALDKEPGRRYPSGAALSAALAAAVAGSAVPAYTATPAAAVIGRSVPLEAAAGEAIPVTPASRVRPTFARFLGARRLTAGAALLLAGMVRVFALGARAHDAPPLNAAPAPSSTATSENGAARGSGLLRRAIAPRALSTQSPTPTVHVAGTGRLPARRATATPGQDGTTGYVHGTVSNRQTPVPARPRSQISVSTRTRSQTPVSTRTRSQTGVMRTATPPSLSPVRRVAPVTASTPRATRAPSTRLYTGGDGHSHRGGAASSLSERTKRWVA